mmetsp:Transcript_74077/g.130959  ORF Transcript_74077/g.130959 Transcript_74077/m.130959 type:complete len:311 (-) Transcript_74077:62-994(-)|eukprot:CAMPEP_0197629354 /NCGR_PEP_ID=MMETSP1338-20131121/7243_1 /TAXON_ID=43686 ORGANISM="Pelagodinium beii, Strain RCC1491" /NCGR_SAMPLE_ID=MMETSP1338 /ASSEMBLY_ACC=CAM_ASM_000754 /LENGTH=310 /DNA_ID=CAMNT_0043200389 /DNA_START=28 /DNA_END=960 /DNA_ORIENTATION=+
MCDVVELRRASSPDDSETPRTPGQLDRGRLRCRRQSVGGLIRRPSSGDDSLAEAAGSLDISCEIGADCSTGEMSWCAATSVSSSRASWSPASSSRGQVQRRVSKRRSISDLSQSARMTPKDLENRGLGIPWQKPAGLCTMSMPAGEAAEQGRNACLIPTPELGRGKAQAQSPGSPEQGSPSSLQRSFVDRVRRASLCDSPDAEGSSAADRTAEMPWSPCPASPQLGCCSPLGQAQEPEIFKQSPRRIFSPGKAPAAAWQRSGSRVQQQILKARRQNCHSGLNQSKPSTPKASHHSAAESKENTEPMADFD